MANFVEVSKIENCAIYLKNGSLRAVLEVIPINFSILGEVEQKAVIFAYKDFLNSLDFPVQIVMRTSSLNVDDYLFSLRKKVFELNNRELGKQFDSFREFVETFIKENSVKNRLFYVVVPFSPYSRVQPLNDLIVWFNGLFGNKGKTSVELNREISLNQLNVRTELCKEKLKKCGLIVNKLNDNQLFSLISSFFNPFIAVENDYLFPLTLLEKFGSGSIVKKEIE